MSITTMSGQQELVPSVNPNFSGWFACFVLYIKLAFQSNIGLCTYILVDGDHFEAFSAVHFAHLDYLARTYALQ